MNILINERQESLLLNLVLNEGFTSTYGMSAKVLDIKEFLDKNFIRGSIQKMKGTEPSSEKVVVRLIDGKPQLPMTDRQLFEYIQSHDRFTHMFSENERDEILKEIIIAWYDRRISKNGTIMSN